MMGTHTLRGEKLFPFMQYHTQQQQELLGVERSHMWMHQIETISKDLCTPNLHQIIDYIIPHMVVHVVRT